MHIKYLKYCKKWYITDRQGHGLAVGDTLGQALADALQVVGLCKM